MVRLVERQQDYQAIARKLSQEFSGNAVARDLEAGLPTYEIDRLRQEGLLTLVIPSEYGGAGESIPTAMKVLQELSKADGSIGQLYCNHLGLTTLAHVSGTSTQKEYYYHGTVEHQWFWGNSINLRDTRLKLTPTGDRFRLDGVKGFGTGIPVADQLVFGAFQEGIEVPFLVVLPKGREGITFNDDWNNVGQRRTASGSVSFDNVRVEPSEILGYPNPPDNAFATFLGIIAQLTKAYVYLGIAEGALEAASQYTRTLSRPWITSGVSHVTADPYILQHYGELWSSLEAAIALADRTALAAQAAWEKESTLTHEERAEVAVAVFATKAAATRAGLEVTNHIFELTGSRSTDVQFGFDRYWRDLRTFTLHDPVDYKYRDIGNWFLNHEHPVVTQYS
ncbi:MAG: acyl-CoA dehydrogenase family protein [Oscillatoriophycideae cyanobacterium NC_groundwater_1537_Pr4_S-0.65um_50_18]|nr:acyl-CoA dehydrogenase family protein [Oscillatoriophycideae cyanobacterium NC_groundwater_1537_Pr4_S-0.65um_50_18]